MTDSTDNPRFIFRKVYEDTEGYYDVSVARDDDDKYGVNLGRVRFYDHKKPGYWIIRETSPENLSEHLEAEKFDTKEKAALFAYEVHRRAEEYRTSKPLPDDVCHYLAGRAEELQKELQELRRRFFEIQIERCFLRKLGDRNQISRVMWNTNDSDNAKLVRDLLDFEVYVEAEERSVPFISEAALYNLIGKEDARTALALIHKICEAVAPDVMDEIKENEEDDDDDDE